jgi:hypothetical protein
MDPGYQFDVDQDSADHFVADPDPTVLQKKAVSFLASHSRRYSYSKRHGLAI